LNKNPRASKVLGVPISKFLKLPGQNDIWMEPLGLITENTIRGKVVDSPKSEPW